MNAQSGFNTIGKIRLPLLVAALAAGSLFATLDSAYAAPSKFNAKKEIVVLKKKVNRLTNRMKTITTVKGEPGAQGAMGPQGPMGPIGPAGMIRNTQIGILSSEPIRISPPESTSAYGNREEITVFPLNSGTGFASARHVLLQFTLEANSANSFQATTGATVELCPTLAACQDTTSKESLIFLGKVSHSVPVNNKSQVHSAEQSLSFIVPKGWFYRVYKTGSFNYGGSINIQRILVNEISFNLN